MNRVEILAAIQKFGLKARSLPSARIKIQGNPSMSEPEAIEWLEFMSQHRCRECGRPLPKKRK